MPQGRPKKVVLDDGYANGAQWTAIYDALHDRVKPIALTLYETGMRPKECLNMRWDWLSEKARGRWIITVPKSADKTGSEHDIPVSARLLAMFETLGIGTRDRSGLVFPSHRKGTLNMAHGSIVSSFRAAVKRCGLNGRGITPYALRRTRLTIWDAIDPNACRYAAGHTVREVHLKHYVRIPLERLFNLVNLDFVPTSAAIRNNSATA